MASSRLLLLLLLLCLLALLLCCSSASSSSLHRDEELKGTWRNVRRRYLVARKDNGRPATAAAFSSSLALRLEPPRQQQTGAKRKVLLFVELLAGAVTGAAIGAAVVVRLLSSVEEEEERKRPIGNYTILDPDFVWAEELSSLICRGELELSSMEIIGRGACGVVYRVEMPDDKGMALAVKRVDNQPPVGAAQLCKEDKHVLDKATRQIRSEIMTAGFLRHPNILPLLAHVHRNDRHYLVYEYMKNGSLQDALREAAKGTRELCWPARLKIARGIAAGLEYLHIVHRPAVIHRDLKPANILLDDAMEARISDFGLAKEATHLHDELTTSNVAGTIGYIAPEYYQVMRFTDKCDVYSYGVILAALVTGRMPTDRFFQTTEEMCLVGWLRSAMRSEEPAATAVDGKLLGKGLEEQMVLALKVACFCTYDNPAHRPNIRDVRCMLSQINH